MGPKLRVSDLSPEEYDDFKRIMIEEAYDVLSNRKEYIETDSFSTSSKIVHLDRLSDFFYLEDEFEVTRDFNSLKKTIIVRHFLRDQIKDI